MNNMTVIEAFNTTPKGKNGGARRFIKDLEDTEL